MARGHAKDRVRAAGTSGSTRIAALLVAALALLSCITALSNGFTLDAQFELTENRFVTGDGHLLELLSSDAWAGYGVETGFWRPVIGLLDWLLWRAGHGAAWPFLLANAITHALVSVAAYGLIRRITRRPEIALTAAALFAVHPVHCDVLAGVVGLKDLIAALLGLLAWQGVLSSRARTGPGARAAGLAIVFILFLLALMAKESALGLLPAIIAIDVLSNHREDRIELARVKRSQTEEGQESGLYFPGYAMAQYAALLLALVAKLGLQHALIGSLWSLRSDALAMANPLALLDPIASRIQALRLLPLSVRLIVWPLHLSPEYSFDAIRVSDNPFEFAVVAGALILASLLAASWWAWRRRDIALWSGIALLGATWLPVSNLITLVPGSIFAERYLYLPSLGFCWIVAALLTGPGAVRRFVLAPVVIVVALLLVRSGVRNLDWKNEYTLWTKACATGPACMTIDQAAARQYRLSGEYDRSLATLDAALAYDGYSPVTASLMERWRPLLRHQRALTFVRAGKTREAGDDYRLALEADPSRYDWRLELIQLLETQGDHAGVIQEAEKGLARDPPEETARAYRDREKKALLALSESLFRSGEYVKAVGYLERLVELDPTSIAARANLGINLFGAHELDRARAIFEELRRSDSENPLHAYYLGLVLEALGRPGEARTEWLECRSLLREGDPLLKEVERRLAR